MQIMPFGEVATIVQLPWALMKISATAPVCARPCAIGPSPKFSRSMRTTSGRLPQGICMACAEPGMAAHQLWIYRLFSDRPSQGEHNHEAAAAMRSDRLQNRVMVTSSSQATRGLP